MMEEGMVERVARAMMAAFKAEVGGHPIPGDIAADSWTARGTGSIDLTILARAAIEAMREPTEAMLEAGRNPPSDLVLRDSRSADERARAAAVWRAMVTASLATPPTEEERK